MALYLKTIHWIWKSVFGWNLEVQLALVNFIMIKNSDKFKETKPAVICNRFPLLWEIAQCCYAIIKC